MMESGRLEFSSDHVNEAVHRIENSGKQIPLSLDRNLNRISILRSVSRHNCRVYCFVHLTFQEFFAARKLAVDEALRLRLLKKHKYDPRFKVVWFFAADLLSMEPKKLGSYFDMLEQEPRNLIGDRHLSLILDYLYTSSCQLDQSRRTQAYENLSARLNLALMLHCQSTIASHPDFPSREDSLGVNNKLRQQFGR